MASLYEIIGQIENFDYQFDEETGEMLNAHDLDELNIEKDKKIENVCLYIKNLLADAEAYKREKDSFAEKQRRAEKKAEGLKEYVAYCLQGEAFKSDRVDVGYRKSVVVQVPDDYTKVDDDYLKYKEPTIDKDKIKRALKSGVEIEGCSLVEKQNIQIK